MQWFRPIPRPGSRRNHQYAWRSLLKVELLMYFFFCIYGLCGAAPLIYRKVRSAVAEIFDMLVPVLLYIVPQV